MSGKDSMRWRITLELSRARSAQRGGNQTEQRFGYRLKRFVMRSTRWRYFFLNSTGVLTFLNLLPLIVTFAPSGRLMPVPTFSKVQFVI